MNDNLYVLLFTLGIALIIATIVCYFSIWYNTSKIREEIELIRKAIENKKDEDKKEQ